MRALRPSNTLSKAKKAMGVEGKIAWNFIFPLSNF
jgi:hypothetical protein